MRLFVKERTAKDSSREKKKLWMNSLCPFNTGYDKMCGSWCALFYVDQMNADSKPYVILGCKGSDKRLYADEIIE